MNNEEARNILSVYRPGGADAGDPYFEGALKQARRDPELAQWFEDERRFDRAVSEALQSIDVPAEGKTDLLAVSKMDSRVRRFPQWANALAAGIVLAAGILFAWLAIGERKTDGIPVGEGVGAFVEMAAAAMPFDYRAESVAELSAWLGERGAPVPGKMPEGILAGESLGCRVFSDDAGNRISLLCFVVNGDFVHFFVTEDGLERFPQLVPGSWEVAEGWNTYSWIEEGRGYVVLSRAPRGELETWLQEV